MAVEMSPFYFRKSLAVPKIERVSFDKSLNNTKKHEFGCLMAEMPDDICNQIKVWIHSNIPEVHLGIGGAEEHIHITIKYGFKDSSKKAVDELKEYLASIKPFPVRLASVSMFEGNKDGDVLKVDIDSRELHRINREITERFDCEDKYPTYLPHLTLAYLNPTYSHFYAKMKPEFLGRTVMVNAVQWSGSNGKKEIIYLDDVITEQKTLSAYNLTSGGALVGSSAPKKVARSPFADRLLGKGNHNPGDKWQGQSGRWFTMTQENRVVPTEAPGGGEQPGPYDKHPKDNEPPKNLKQSVAEAKSKIIDHISKATEKAPKKAQELYEKAVGKVADKMSEKARERVKKFVVAPAMYAEHQLQKFTHASQKMVSEVARQQGLSDAGVKKVEAITKWTDFALSWTINIPTLHHALAATGVGGVAGFMAAKFAYYVPVASLLYITGSTVATPLATIRAADKLIRGGSESDRHKALEQEKANLFDEESTKKLCELYKTAEDTDWLEALMCVAVDKTHDASKAVEEVSKILQTHPTDPDEKQEVDVPDIEAVGVSGVKAIVKKQDKRGYNICYDDQTGARVACNKVTPPKVKPKANKKEDKEEGKKKKEEGKEKKPTKQKATAEEAKVAIDRAKEGGIDSNKMYTLVDTLNGMTVVELQKLRKTLGAKTATRKADIIEKLKENLATAPKPQPKAPESKIESSKQEEKKPEPKAEGSGTKQIEDELRGMMEGLEGDLLKDSQKELDRVIRKLQDKNTNPLIIKRAIEAFKEDIGLLQQEQQRLQKQKKKEDKEKGDSKQSPQIKAIREAVLAIGDTADKIKEEMKALETERVSLWAQSDKARRDPKKIKAINAKLEKIADRQSTLLRNRVDARKESHKKIADLLKGDSKLTPEIQEGLNATAQKEVDEGLSFINSILKGGVTDKIKFKPVTKEDRCSRSHYDFLDNNIRLDAKDRGTSTVVHEVGHWLENNVPGANKAVRDFLNRRVGKEEYTSLAKLFPSYNYDAHEMGRKDNFGKLWGEDSSRAYYAGKSYGDKDTEILSMGLDTLYDDPVGFAKKDPEYFELIVGVLEGSGRVGNALPREKTINVNDEDDLIDLN